MMIKPEAANVVTIKTFNRRDGKDLEWELYEDTHTGQLDLRLKELKK
jgi:hypothetical protein